jgi:hypothetical protein
MSAAVQSRSWKQVFRPVLVAARSLRERYFGEVGYLTRRLHRLQVALAHGPRIRDRRALAAAMPISPLAREIAAALESRGYYFTSVAALGGDPAVVDYCRALGARVAQKSVEDVVAMRTGKSKTYWLDLFQDKEIRSNPILDFVTLPVLLQAAARYLGEVPILSYISLFFTPPGTAHLMLGSQGWHRDNEQMRQMKIFLLAHPVESAAGPSKLLPKPYSAHGYRNYPGYFTDDQFREFGLPEKELVEFTGDSGSVLLIDTSALFHCGSRTMTQPRLQMIAAYHPLMSNLPYRVFKAAQLPEATYPKTNEKILRAFEQRNLQVF